MKGEHYEIRKNVAIKFQGRLYPYPLNPVQALRNMQTHASLRCGFSFLWNLLTNHRSLDQLRTSEEFFVRNFGWELYRIFFEGYTHKVWGIHPRDLSADFIKNRLPPASLLRIALTALTGRDIKIRKPHEVPLKLQIFYPREGSIQFPKAMGREVMQRGGRISLNCSLRTVELREGKVRAVVLEEGGRQRREECQFLVSTVPLTDLIQALDPPPPPEVLKSGRHLDFRPILIACLWIDKPEIFPYQTIYYTNRLFNRLAQMNSYSPHTVPPGTCGVTAEMTCRPGDELWSLEEKTLLKKVVADMEAEGLIRAEQVKDGMVLRNLHGYPVYRLGFQEHLLRLRRTVHEISNLYVGGRQGMFNYAQMHYGVSSGMQIARQITEGNPKPSLPEQDTENVFFA
jgi:protoporphyrinogen oxidase